VAEGVSVADANAAYLVKKAVCKEYGITYDEIISRRRDDMIAWPRHVAMWCCLKLYNWGNVKNARIFDRDRTMNYHAVKRVNDRMDVEPLERDRIQKVLLHVHELARKLQPIFHDARLADKLLEGRAL